MVTSRSTSTTRGDCERPSTRVTVVDASSEAMALAEAEAEAEAAKPEVGWSTGGAVDAMVATLIALDSDEAEAEADSDEAEAEADSDEADPESATGDRWSVHCAPSHQRSWEGSCGSGYQFAGIAGSAVMARFVSTIGA